jgi:rubrerythrin
MDITHASTAHWSLDQIGYERIDVERVRRRDELFLLVCSASFIESGSDTYTRNLIDYFAGDAEFGHWLQDRWEPEELQHGRALRTYLQHVWPDFDWDAAYAGFFAEYAQLCVVEELEPTRSQELVARCIVETGTTTYYQALAALADEPVLHALASRIRADEVGHYKQFYHQFLKYREREGLGRAQVIAAIWRRVAELRRSDSDIALRHAADALGGRAEALRDQLYATLAQRYPVDLAVRMALKPLRLRAGLQRCAERPLGAVMRRLMH